MTNAALDAVATGISDFASVEPTVAGAISMFVPAASPIIAVIQPFMPAIMAFAARGIHDISTSNGGDVPAAIIEFIQHVTKGQPNSATLNGLKPPMPPAASGS